ncbi:MAG: hypothetical protein ACE5EE_11295 [Fidelibacterota bacterium]
MRFENYYEDRAVQIMYIGHFADENGYRLYKKHHEIYLGDPRRTKPENLRTIIRHPVIEE